MKDTPKDRATSDDRQDDVAGECVAALTDCSRACTEFVDRWLTDDHLAAEETLVRAGLECAGICQATIKLLSRRSGYVANLLRPMLRACATAATRCRLESQSHSYRQELGRGQEDARRKCEQACRRSEDALARLLEAMR